MLQMTMAVQTCRLTMPVLNGHTQWWGEKPAISLWLNPTSLISLKELGTVSP